MKKESMVRIMLSVTKTAGLNKGSRRCWWKLIDFETMLMNSLNSTCPWTNIGRVNLRGTESIKGVFLSEGLFRYAKCALRSVHAYLERAKWILFTPNSCSRCMQQLTLEDFILLKFMKLGHAYYFILTYCVYLDVYESVRCDIIMNTTNKMQLYRLIYYS
jgi:hypothetical protein